MKMFGRNHQLFAVAILLLSSAIPRVSFGQFSTVLNLPPDPDIASSSTIGSDTQVNLFEGGVIGLAVDAGAPDGSSTNIEINVEGGFAGGNFNAHAGTTVNLASGRIHIGFDAFDGSQVNVTGGSLGSFFNAYSGSQVSVAGGIIGGSFRARTGSVIDISGGSFDSFVDLDSGSSITLNGNDFRIDGTPIGGLETLGTSLAFDPPFGTVLSGILSDGTPFAVSNNDADWIDTGTLTLTTTTLPAVGPALTHVSDDTSLMSIRNGQTLIVEEGGSLPRGFHAGIGSKVIINGGYVGVNFEAIGSEVLINGGAIDVVFDAFSGSVVTMTGGTMGGVAEITNGSIFNLSGGSIDNGFQAHAGGTMNISGGSIGRAFKAYSGSLVNISGGSVGEEYDAFGGSTTNISGGMVGDKFSAGFNSIVNLIGTEFVLNGIPITESLTPGIPLTIEDRNVTLSGLLSDGSPFSFFLDSSFTPSGDSFSSGALVTVTQIPEPCTIMLCGIASILTLIGRSRFTKTASTPHRVLRCSR